jgi:hypothetical protein
MLNDPERFRGHDPNLNPGGEFIFLPVFLAQRANTRHLVAAALCQAHRRSSHVPWRRAQRDGYRKKSDIVSILVSVVHFVTFVRDNVS